MSSPSRTVEPDAAGPHPVVALVRGGAVIDSGQPVDDLPPLIEPVALEAKGRRPPRQKFLAASARVAEPEAVPADAPSFEIPPLIEPVAPEAPAAAETTATSAWTTSIPARLGEWASLARGWSAYMPRSRLALGAAAGVALCLLVLLAEVIGVGPFSHARHYPTPGAPGDPAGRLAYFQEGAQAGDANAELELAILYAKGEGVKQDYATAATWFRAAANQGVTRAQFDLGVLYERGRGVAVDLTEAANWYLKAAQGGHPLAQYNLAVCYTKGQGIRQDPAEAALWYRRAATQGVVQAMVNLAMMYEKGEGVTASPVDAYAWFLAAGRRDNQAAARHAQDMFAAMPRLDQIRAEALASDVAASIHDPERGGSAPAAAKAGEH